MFLRLTWNLLFVCMCVYVCAKWGKELKWTLFCIEYNDHNQGIMLRVSTNRCLPFCCRQMLESSLKKQLVSWRKCAAVMNVLLTWSRPCSLLWLSDGGSYLSRPASRRMYFIDWRFHQFLKKMILTFSFSAYFSLSGSYRQTTAKAKSSITYNNIFPQGWIF